jgi:hypothetical protein
VPNPFPHDYGLQGHQLEINPGRKAMNMGHSLELAVLSQPCAMKWRTAAALARSMADQRTMRNDPSPFLSCNGVLG